jgi:P27 family predicted phage terminase small subunit
VTRGRKPDPTALKVLRGNPGCRPLNDREAQPSRGLPDPPEHFSEQGKRLWTEIGKRLDACGLMTEVDVTAFELLIDSLVEWQTATQNVAKLGPIWMEKGDGKIPKFAYSPFWVQANRASKRLHGLLREFGMTPSARSSIKTAGPIDEEEDPLKEFGIVG